MTTLLGGFHPAFDALSAIADMSEAEAARTRIGRHAAACAVCTGTVRELRALGAAARDVELPGAPDGLWERIDAARRQGTSPAIEPMPDTQPARRTSTAIASHGGRSLRRAAMVMTAAAAVVAVLLLPVTPRQALEAGTADGRWRFEPATPAAGATVQVRYEAPAEARRGAHADEALMLLGGRPSRWDDPVTAQGIAPALEDSLAVLRRQPDGGYAGSFVFPRDARALVVRLRTLDGAPVERVMTTSGPVARRPEPAAILVSGDAGGRPSLAALTEASSLWTGSSRPQFDVGDTLIRYFPTEPLGYAVAGRGAAPHRVLDEVVAWFKRGERQYLRFDARFTREPALSAERQVAMIRLANRIDEPGEARKWALRLAREHGDDPRTLYVYARMLAQMLDRPGTIDSVRRDLPLADTLWERNGHRGVDMTLPAAAATVGDHGAHQRWMVRLVMGGEGAYDGVDVGLNEELLHDPAMRSALLPVLGRRMVVPCTLPAGKYPTYGSRDRSRAACESSRASVYSTRSVLERLEGRPRQALVLADSSLAAYVTSGWCGESVAHRRRGEALLDLRDTAAAIPELAAGLGYGDWRGNARRDSLAVALRAAVSPDAWRRLADSAQARVNSCVADRARRLRSEASRG